VLVRASRRLEQNVVEIGLHMVAGKLVARAGRSSDRDRLGVARYLGARMGDKITLIAPRDW